MAARLLWQHGFPLCEITHPPKQQQGMRETTKSVTVASFSLQLSSGDGRGGGGKPFFACKVRLAVYSSIKLLLLFQFLMHTRQGNRALTIASSYSFYFFYSSSFSRVKEPLFDDKV